MKSHYIVLMALPLACAFPQFSYARRVSSKAASTENIENPFSDIKSIYKKSSSFTELLQNTKSQLSADEFRFFEQKIKELSLTKLPVWKQVSNTEIELEMGNLSVPFQVISLRERKFSFNRKIVFYKSTDSIETFTDRLRLAMPSQGTHRFFEQWLLPQAHAALPIAAAYWIGTGLVGAYIANGIYCDEIKKAANDCKTPIRGMTRILVKFEKEAAEAKNKPKKKQKKQAFPVPQVADELSSTDPVCHRPINDEEDEKSDFLELESDATEALDNVKQALSASTSKFVFGCSKQIERAEICKKTITDLAKKVCMDVEVDLKSLVDKTKKRELNPGARSVDEMDSGHTDDSSGIRKNPAAGSK